MIQQQPLPTIPIVTAAAKVASGQATTRSLTEKPGFLKFALIILAVWQALLIIVIIISSLQINQLSNDLSALKQQANLLNHFEQIQP